MPDAASTRRSRRATATAGASGDPARAMTRRERRMRVQQETAQQQSAPETAPVPPPDVPAADEMATSDDFAAAAAALNFTGESAKTRTDPAPEATRQETRRATKGQRTLNTPFRKFAAATGSVAAVGAIALLALGVALPLAAPTGGAEVVADMAADSGKTSAAADPSNVEGELQGYVAGDDIETAPLERVEGYEASTFSDVAAMSGISTSGAFFDNDPTADVQWPFAVGTSMSSPFGYRWGRLHEGVDFTPGDGAPVQAIADGVVRTATEAGGAYGVNVYIDHVIDGELVTSHYAHMQYGSLQVANGQRVEVGDIIGKTGNTGRSYGSHLHFEIRYNDTAIDPLPWLREHANRHYSADEQTQVESLETEMLGQDFTE